ncbi:MAG: hypothetical protein HY402_06370 [Elusimicrobia bacterium]|nr:hypothetical protein [Elusimicrobiota bacterium]
MAIKKSYLLLSGLLLLSAAALTQEQAGKLTDVVIVGKETRRLTSEKPSLQLEIDENAAIRDSIPTDPSVLLTKPPSLLLWKQTHPEFLRNSRVIQPHRIASALAPQIEFEPLKHYREMSAKNPYSGRKPPSLWSLTVADRNGRMFQRFEGTGEPPEQIAWNGRNDNGEWIEPGRTYSTVLMYLDDRGSAHTEVGKTIEFSGVIHQTEEGLTVGLDSKILFGTSKDKMEVEDPEGVRLLRAAADLLKRRYYQFPLMVEVRAKDSQTAQAQAESIRKYLADQLKMLPQNIPLTTHSAPSSQQNSRILVRNQ